MSGPKSDPYPKLHVLAAWPYVKGTVLERLKELNPTESRFLLDSGAFTAWKAGKVLQLDDYCRFVESLPVRPWRYFSLDVIGNPHATLKNYEAMLARGFNPVPVFTRGEDPSVLEEYFRTSEVVGLGGVAKADQSAYAWARWAMQKVAGRKVHILGFTSMDWVKFLRPYSVDSSSWNGFGRYGGVDVYMGHGKFTKIDRKTAAKKLKEPALVAALRRLGVEPTDLMKPEAWAGDRALCGKLCAASWVACSAEVGRGLDTHLFLAAATDWQVTNLRDAYNSLRQAAHPAFRAKPVTTEAA
jgi:hypothetical protein